MFVVFEHFGAIMANNSRDVKASDWLCWNELDNDKRGELEGGGFETWRKELEGGDFDRDDLNLRSANSLDMMSWINLNKKYSLIKNDIEYLFSQDSMIIYI